MLGGGEILTEGVPMLEHDEGLVALSYSLSQTNFLQQ
jgi:hypothetical protein